LGADMPSWSCEQCGAWWGRDIARDAKALFGVSVERYLAAIR
jgi:hypothetical protein